MVLRPRRPWRGLLLMATAMALHGSWDAAAAIGGPGRTYVVLGVITVAGLVALVVAIRLAGGRFRVYAFKVRP